MTPSVLRGPVRSPWCWAVVGVWLTLLVQTWQGGLSPRWQHLLLCGVTVGAAASCWARVVRVREDRLVWSLVALGLSGYGGGFVVLFHVSTGEGAGPFGLNASDCVSLVLYPSAYAALVLLTAARVSHWSRGALLDGVVVSFAASAVALAAVAAWLPGLLEGGLDDVLYALAYPVGGFTLLAITVSGLVVTRSRPDGVWLLLLLGFAAWTAGDVEYAVRSAEGTFWFGTPLDAVYTAGPVLVSLAAWARPRPVERAETGATAAMAVPGLATLCALGVLVDRSPRLPLLAVVLAAGVVVAAVLRTVVFVRQERLLAQRTREANTDELTGLVNRRGLLLALESRLAQPGALLRVDLDHFSQVNDALGHVAGDRLLVELTRRLVGAHPGAVVGRLSGAGFSLLLDEADVALALEVVALLEEPYTVDGCDVAVSAAVGLAAWQAGEVGSGAELLRRADIALHAARSAAAGPQVWTPRHDEDARERLAVVADLLTALEADDQLLVHLQPKSDPRTREVLAAEALVRWQHPRRGMVAPYGFLAAAEGAGLLSAITTRVLELTLGHVVRLRDAGVDVPVAINVCAADLLDPGFPARVSEALRRHGLPARVLRIEVTETVVMSDPDRIMSTLLRLRALGVGLSLDDYGTGLSSLTYLRQLPVDELKIDRSFVSRLVDDPASRLIVASTVALAHGLGLHVVAEGVEDEATLAALGDVGCDLVQGYLLGRPGPVEALLPGSVPAQRVEVHA